VQPSSISTRELILKTDLGPKLFNPRWQSPPGSWPETDIVDRVAGSLSSAISAYLHRMLGLCQMELNKTFIIDLQVEIVFRRDVESNEQMSQQWKYLLHAGFLSFRYTIILHFLQSILPPLF
jgi:hypothetical protein